ncbi:DeoR/GlpR family DNA-binding transcription regulator [Deinococcus ruber]|uniref:DeoR family transcriptional regulator n=1 Tax=Deinococcus ruber TaxID=1848197 RepID=A0A918BWD8_9DEIO|nr:DeoR/GlpR family DNA-binding transcription regulator [Deinococcus ruber]GGQ95684.1 DeoR family transcriptional regulator [Deinococcus ruber]
MQKDRQDDILSLLGERDGASVGELSKLLGVSEVTIRSDLTGLAQAGLVRRTRGGARPLNVSERPLEETTKQHSAIKRRIGAAAAQRVQDGQTIFLDVGSTTTEIARHLSPNLRGVTVVTNGLNIALELERYSGLHIIVTGGSLRRLQHSLVAPYALELLSRIRADVLFLGCNGVDAQHGVTNLNFGEAEVKARMVEYAREVVVVADPSKIGQVTRAHIVPVNRVQVLMTGRQADQDALCALSEQIPEIVTV